MPLDLPATPGFTRQRWGIASNTQIFESPLTKSVQRNGLTGARWLSEYEFPHIKARAIMAEWESFFAQLEGRANTFSAKPPFRSEPRGVGSGFFDFSTFGDAQVGSSVVVVCQVSTTNVLRKGDYIQFAETLQVCLVTDDVDSDNLGVATVPIKPPIRDSLTSGFDVLTDDVSVPMILVIDEVSWETDMFAKSIFRFSGIEVF